MTRLPSWSKLEEAEEGEGHPTSAGDEPTGAYIFMATAYGTVKKTPLIQFTKPRSNGLIALNLDEGDYADRRRHHRWLQGRHDVLQRRQGDPLQGEQGAHHGPSGPRRARHELAEDQRSISMLIPELGAQILTASERGYGKRTPLAEFPRRGRGGQGVIAMVVNERTAR